MNVIVLDTEAYAQLTLELKKYVKEALLEILAAKNTADDSDWVTLAEAQKLLPFRSKTSWQKLRDTGTILFTQPNKGRKIMYSKKSITAYLNKNKVES